MRLINSLIRPGAGKRTKKYLVFMDVDFMAGQLCSTENLAIGIWKQLEPHLPKQVKLHCIKLYETSRIYVEYFGEQ